MGSTHGESLRLAQRTPTPIGIPPGVIMAWPGAAAPDGWLLLQGQAVSRTDYETLFALFGTTYGTGNGTTTFNLPDCRGRALVGVDSSQAEFTPLGRRAGAKTHTLTTAQMPAHTHTYETNSAVAQFSVAGGTGMNNRTATAATSSTGGGEAHNNLQPYIALNWIIKV